MIGLRSAIHRKSHFSAQDDMRGFRAVLVVRITRVRHIFPDISARETLTLQLSDEFIFGHP